MGSAFTSSLVLHVSLLLSCGTNLQSNLAHLSYNISLTGFLTLSMGFSSSSSLAYAILFSLFLGYFDTHPFHNYQWGTCIGIACSPQGLQKLHHHDLAKEMGGLCTLLSTCLLAIVLVQFVYCFIAIYKLYKPYCFKYVHSLFKSIKLLCSLNCYVKRF